MRPAKIPLIPAMRPVDRASSTAESPISAPPIAAETGVKLSMTSPLLTLRLRCVEATLSTLFDRDLGSGDYHAIREISDDRLERRRDENVAIWTTRRSRSAATYFFRPEG
jgi:hypothetical protein